MQKIKKLSKKIKYIVVHNKFKSLGFIDGILIEVKNNNLVNNKNINITGAGDTFTASLINDFITNNICGTFNLLEVGQAAGAGARGAAPGGAALPRR